MIKKLFARFWRGALIAALLVSALFLVRAAGYFSAWRGAQAGSSGGSSAGTAAAETVGSVRPSCVLVCDSGAKSASAYDGETTMESFGRFSAFLGEALGSAGEPAEMTERDFRSALGGGSVLFTFETPQPLSLLSAWLGTEMSGGAAAQSTQLLALCLTDGTAELCFRTAEGEFFRCATAAQSETLRSRMQGFSAAAAPAELAYEDRSYAALEPYTVILQETPAVYAAQSASAMDTIDRTALMETLGMNSFVASSYREADGTVVMIDDDRTLRFGTDGSVSFRSGAEVHAAAGTQTAAASLAYAVAEQSLGHICGAAALTFSAAQRTEAGTWSVCFDYSLRGIPVQLNRGHAAEITVCGGEVCALTLQPLRFTLLEQTETLLPMPFAAAVVNAGGGGALRLVYTGGGEALHCVWVNS